MSQDHGTEGRGRVLVIGNGPVGQTAALCLARWGIPVLVLDSRPERDPIGSKALCQQRDVLDLWDACGAGAVATEGLTWSRARTFYKDKELFCWEIPDPGRSPLPPFVNISQARSEAILDEAIAAQPLIEVWWGTEVVGVAGGKSDSDGLATVVCRSGFGEFEVAGEYAVVCAGSKGGPLREALGVTFPGRTFDDSFLICDIETTLKGWENERRFYFDPEWNPGRQVLIHPCPNSIFRIDWQVDTDFDLAAAQADGSLDKRIRKVIGKKRDYRIDWVSVYRFHARSADRFRVGRFLLAGDVAHLVAPFGARGLNSGVPDVENAAWKIAFAMKGWAGPGLVGSYESERQAAARENLAVTAATMDFLVPQTKKAKHRRKEILKRARKDKKVIPLVDSGRLAEAFWYVDSPLTTPDPSRFWPGRPPRGQAPTPVPGVILPDAVTASAGHGKSRVRELAREGLLILVGEAVNTHEVEGLLSGVVPAGLPVRVLHFSDLGDEDVVATGLQAVAEELWLIRPDAHTAACVRTPEALADAVHTLLGH
ncbi:MAG: FAD-dependent monooxygenase [Actinomycetales bacterium]|uniref:FAD-dependent monooxygenase n=2 Tax=Candidatus Phosphoribacter hodrii TaxID=2953743 RepID=A0A935IL06_9MICO|nr:FAD-dependent monooxygenase [Candidatus Phosphoribacter hodrii]HOA02989.1 FAD-dependent monooxygenase [Dermatophilaceae bacterium]HRC65175.1 FAD-dependent monooxygenase [Dermatophilaceae bacterium]